MNTQFLKKASAVAVSSMVGFGLLATVAIAQGTNANRMNVSINEHGSVKLTGTVSAISGSTVSVSSWLGTWTVNATSVKILPANSNLSDIKVGDKVAVHGTMGSGMNITAKSISNSSFKDFKKAVVGTISNLNATAGTFTLTVKNSVSVNMATNASTQVFVNGTASSLAHLSNGMNAAVSGSFNNTTNIFTATTIRTPAPTVMMKENGIIKALKKFFKRDNSGPGGDKGNQEKNDDD